MPALRPNHDASTDFPSRFLAARLAQDAGPAGQPSHRCSPRRCCPASLSVTVAASEAVGAFRVVCGVLLIRAEQQDFRLLNSRELSRSAGDKIPATCHAGAYARLTLHRDGPGGRHPRSSYEGDRWEPAPTA